MFVDIAFPISTFKVFTYKVPLKFENSISVGCLVKAPLNEKESIGIVFSIRYKKIIKAKLKSILKVERSPVINEEVWDLATTTPSRRCYFWVQGLLSMQLQMSKICEKWVVYEDYCLFRMLLC